MCFWGWDFQGCVGFLDSRSFLGSGYLLGDDGGTRPATVHLIVHVKRLQQAF